MRPNKPDKDYMEGRLPIKAPLANPFVPFQMEQPVKYEARKGLVRGTLYPGLDLPFLGMVNKKMLPDTKLSELQAIDFAIQELALYLDTHRDDQEALELYRQYQQMHFNCRNEMSKRYGPMNHMEKADRDEYGWLNDPWPWEYVKNMEGMR